MSKALYGGAITVVLPSSYHDVSSHRQVPDHQEVWLDLNGDCSFICEIVEAQSEVSPGEAAAYFWQDLCESNDSSETQKWREINDPDVLDPFLPAQFREPKASPCDRVVFCCGWQTSTNSNNSIGDVGGETNRVFICLAILRLHGVGAEMLLTLNAPQKNCSSTLVLSDLEHETRALDTFRGILSTFEIRQWELFAS